MSHEHPEENEWVSPIMTNYRMICCDCGLVHELDFKVVKYIGKRRKNGLQKCVDIDDPDTQVLFRARRIDE